MLSQLETCSPAFGRSSALNLRTVLFDVGNTLIDLNFRRIAKLLHLGELSPMTIELARIQAALEMNAAYKVRTCPQTTALAMAAQALSSVAGTPALASPLLEQLAAYDGENSLWDQPNPGAVQLLQRLKASGMKLGIISNSDGRVPNLLHRLGLCGFEVVIDSALVGVAKPDPEIFTLAREAVGSQPEEIAYVGDVPRLDAAGALLAGFNPIIYDRLNLFDQDCRELAAIHGRDIWRVASLLDIERLRLP